MAQRLSKGIDTSRLPSAQELIALAQTPDAGAGIEKFGSGVVGGIDLASRLADRQMNRQKEMLAMQEIIRKAKQEADQKKREQNIAAEITGTTPAATRVAANIGGQPVQMKETKQYADEAPVRLQAALSSAEPLQATKDILATSKEQVKSERDNQEAINMQNLKFGQAKELLTMKETLGKKNKGGKIPTSLINDQNLIMGQAKQLDAIEDALMPKNAKGVRTDTASGVKGLFKSLASKATLGNVGGTDLRLYEQNRPAVAVSIYRALTGDSRLSDADARARALPLLPLAGEPADVQKRKIAYLRAGISRREQIIKQVSEMAKNNELTSDQAEAMALLPLPENTDMIDPNSFIE